MIDGRKALRAVRFHHPGVSTKLARDGPWGHGVPGAKLWALSVTTAQEVLRIDGCEEPRHRAVQELLFHGGHAQRTRRALPCGTRVPPDALGAGPLLLQALYEAVDVLVQVLRLGLSAHRVPPSGGILPDVGPALLEQILVQPPREVAEPRALLTFGLLGYALLGGWHCGAAPARAGHVSWAGSVCLSAPSPGARRSRLRVLGAALTP